MMNNAHALQALKDWLKESVTSGSEIHFDAEGKVKCNEALAALTAYVEFVACIVHLKRDGDETDDPNEPYVMENDDAVDKVNRLITEARSLACGSKSNTRTDTLRRALQRSTRLGRH